MSEKIFRRIEQKYILDEKQKNNLLKKILPHLEKDKFYKSEVNNIYFDTEHNDLIIKSIDKPRFKEKLRVRSYGTPGMNDKIFFEIKTKNKKIVGKRRIEITLKEFYDFIEKGKYDKTNQISKEIDYLIKYYNLKPAIYVGYNRESYKGKEEKELRITFDSNLRSRRDNLRLEKGSEGNLYFEEPHYIMEIKALGSYPLWLAKILSEEKLYRIGFSKYGNIYKKESDVKC